jgi:hypothetical protein
MWIRALFIGLLMSAFTAVASAQHFAGGAGLSAGPRMSAGSRSFSRGSRNAIVGREMRPFRGHPSIWFGGSPFWWDEPYDRPSDPTQIVFTPSPSNNALAAAPTAPVAPQDPLLIELRGDRYVRVSSNTQQTSGNSESSVQPGAPLRASQSSLLPTIFVFRDGHREESSDYSIYGGVIYARSEFWTDGAWTKQIQLSALNIAESRKVNEERGVRFLLPGAPNEVVTRP